MPRMFVATLLSQDESSDDQQVEAGPEEHTNGVARTADDWLVKSVERRIDQDAGASGLFHPLKQRVEQAHFAIDRLHPNRACPLGHDVAQPVVAQAVLVF